MIETGHLRSSDNLARQKISPRSSGDEHILHLSLRLKRAIFILRKVKGEVESLVVGDTLYLVNPVGDLEPKVGI